MLDKSKIPTELVIQRMWVPRGDKGRRPIVYVTERRRRIVGSALIGLCVILVLAVVVVNASFWLAFVPLLIAWAWVAYAGGGRSGYYEVSDAGTLGEYLGRTKPDLSSMRAVEP